MRRDQSTEVLELGKRDENKITSTQPWQVCQGYLSDSKEDFYRALFPLFFILIVMFAVYLYHE
ncbi:hypothetical protein PV02_06950 [Methanolobus chelungpuianus]|uniref:Uncharacterized protein n=1 Tax=Methanolobus chelungpuianus TaxID=502115 RepID=A0AAE3KX22_9EURY|nr:hypothetical protein [Methanolobus chelungpuianus]